MLDPYALLGVPRDADEAQIRDAYRRRMLEVHPDVAGSHEAAANVNAAYALLSSDEGRAAYDDTALPVRTADGDPKAVAPDSGCPSARPPIALVVILFLALNAVLLFGLFFNASGARW